MQKQKSLNAPKNSLKNKCLRGSSGSFNAAQTLN
jgi:hypothetical protein